MVAIALIGCGGWGKNLARNLNELGVLNRIIDPSESAGQVAASLGVDHSPYGIAECLSDPDISGVVIASPAITHFQLAMEALKAGKHVYVEKPIALSTAEGRTLEQLAHAEGRTLMVGHLLQYHPVFLKLREMVTAGDFGTVRHVASSRLNFGMIRVEENIVWSFMPHDISMLLALVDAEPRQVMAVASGILQENVCDLATVHIRFGNGILATVNASWLAPEKVQQLSLTGDAGMAVFDDTLPWDQKLRIFPHKVDWSTGRPRAVKAEASNVTIEQGEPLKAEMLHFLDCIATGNRPRTDAVEANGVLAVLEAAQRSIDAEGVWVNV